MPVSHRSFFLQANDQCHSTQGLIYDLHAAQKTQDCWHWLWFDRVLIESKFSVLCKNDCVFVLL